MVRAEWSLTHMARNVAQGDGPDFSSSLFLAFEHSTSPAWFIFAEDRTWRGGPGGERGLTCCP